MQIQNVGTQYSTALKALGLDTGTDTSGDFQNMLSDSIDASNQTDAADKEGITGLLTGDVNNLADASIETQKADLALRLTVQIRNKVIDAYNEVMRMQV
jgi:flagellar hook-basal body complex protein FliE